MAFQIPRQINHLSVLLCLVLVSKSQDEDGRARIRISNESCRQIDACSCVLSNGETIDLHFSDHAQHGVPIFHYHSPSLSENFTFSPCKGFPCGEDPTASGAALCIDKSFLRSFVEIGSMSSARFLLDSGGNVTLVYKSNDTRQNVTSQVSLKCSPLKEQFLMDSSGTGINGSSVHYNFTLHSRCACPGLCGQGSPAKTEQLSPGSILLLIFFSVLVVYFGIGCLYRKAVHGGAEGWTELVPHSEFWFSLPSLIKDGYLFFISPCIGNRAEYRTYDKL